MTQEMFDNFLIEYCKSDSMEKYPVPMVNFVDNYVTFRSGKTMEESLEELAETVEPPYLVTKENLVELFAETLIEIFEVFPYVTQIDGIDEFLTDLQLFCHNYTDGLLTFIGHLQGSDVFKEVMFDVISRPEYARE